MKVSYSSVSCVHNPLITSRCPCILHKLLPASDPRRNILLSVTSFKALQDWARSTCLLNVQERSRLLSSLGPVYPCSLFTRKRSERFQWIFISFLLKLSTVCDGSCWLKLLDRGTEDAEIAIIRDYCTNRSAEICIPDSKV